MRTQKKRTREIRIFFFNFLKGFLNQTTTTTKIVIILGLAGQAFSSPASTLLYFLVVFWIFISFFNFDSSECLRRSRACVLFVHSCVLSVLRKKCSMVRIVLCRDWPKSPPERAPQTSVSAVWLVTFLKRSISFLLLLLLLLSLPCILILCRLRLTLVGDIISKRILSWFDKQTWPFLCWQFHITSEIGRFFLRGTQIFPPVYLGQATIAFHFAHIIRLSFFFYYRAVCRRPFWVEYVGRPHICAHM
jgi:hypothetical protein